MQDLPGLPPWDDLVAESEEYEFDGLLIKVINRATLIELKGRRASAQDLADIEAIELLDRLDE